MHLSITEQYNCICKPTNSTREAKMVFDCAIHGHII